MYYFLIALSLIASLILESTFLEEFKVAGVKPDLLLIFVAFWALFYGSKEGAKMGFIFGLVEDLFVGKFIGLNTLTKTIVGYLIGTMENKFFKDNFLLPVFTSFLATVLHNSLYVIIIQLTRVETGISTFVLEASLPMAIYNACLGLLFYGKFYSLSSKGYLHPGRKND